MPKAFLVGCTGLVGRALIPALRGAGWALRVSLRSSPPPWLTQLMADDDQLTTYTWLGGDQPLPVEAIADCQAVINLAGASIADGRWTASRKKVLRSSRIDTTAHIVKAIAAVAANGPEVLINASGIAIYGLHGGEVSEDDAISGDHFLAELASEWEQAAQQHAPTSLRVVLLRLGVILAADGGALHKIVPPWLPRWLPLVPLAGGRQGMPWIHRDDVVAMIHAALTDHRWQGPVNAVAPQLHTNAAFTRCAARVSGHPYCPLGPPRLALRLALGEQADLVLADILAQPLRASEWDFTWRYRTLEPALQACLNPIC